MVTHYFRYLSWLLRYPAYRDFIDMGLGIEARYRRCRIYWEHHLENCRRFVQTHVCDTHRPSLAILGAGRLYDVNITTLADYFDSIALYDADPSCIPFWNAAAKTAKNLSFHHIEITNCLNSWRRSLRAFLRHNRTVDITALTSLLQSFTTENGQSINAASCASLNLLSQIPIYWRDRVYSMVKYYWALDTDPQGLYPSGLQEALEYSMRILQEQHLKQLTASGSERLVMLYDKQFIFYRSNQREWQTERSIFIPLPPLPKQYKIIHASNWMWDIAPQGVEQSDYGVIHEIEALALERL